MIENRLRENPMDPDALFARAAELAIRKRLSDAIATLNELAKIAPDYPGLWRFKARLYAQASETRLAELCAERGNSSP